MSNNDVLKAEQAQLMERVIIAGDLARISPEDRVRYYLAVCEAVGLNPMTKPFDLITLNGKLTLYVNKSGTDQLRAIKNISICITNRIHEEGLYTVTSKATTPDGRSDESSGVVVITGLKGDALANAIMKAESKSKRRATLSIGGLGWLDETEVDSIPGAQKHVLDIQSGNIEMNKPLGTPEPMKATSQSELIYRMKAEGQKIAFLRSELGMTQEELKVIMLKEFQTDEISKMGLENLGKLVALLQKMIDTIKTPTQENKQPSEFEKFFDAPKSANIE